MSGWGGIEINSDDEAILWDEWAFALPDASQSNPVPLSPGPAFMPEPLFSIPPFEELFSLGAISHPEEPNAAEDEDAEPDDTDAQQDTHGMYMSSDIELSDADLDDMPQDSPLARPPAPLQSTTPESFMSSDIDVDDLDADLGYEDQPPVLYDVPQEPRWAESIPGWARPIFLAVGFPPNELQQEAIENIDAPRDYDVYVTAKTGAGKTLVGILYAHRWLAAGGNVVIISPYVKLCNQWCAELERPELAELREGAKKVGKNFGGRRDVVDGRGMRLVVSTPESAALRAWQDPSVLVILDETMYALYEGRGITYRNLLYCAANVVCLSGGIGYRVPVQLLRESFTLDALRRVLQHVPPRSFEQEDDVLNIIGQFTAGEAVVSAEWFDVLSGLRMRQDKPALRIPAQLPEPLHPKTVIWAPIVCSKDNKNAIIRRTLAAPAFADDCSAVATVFCTTVAETSVAAASCPAEHMTGDTLPEGAASEETAELVNGLLGVARRTMAPGDYECLKRGTVVMHSEVPAEASVLIERLLREVHMVRSRKGGMLRFPRAVAATTVIGTGFDIRRCSMGVVLGTQFFNGKDDNGQPIMSPMEQEQFVQLVGRVGRHSPGVLVVAAGTRNGGSRARPLFMYPVHLGMPFFAGLSDGTSDEHAGSILSLALALSSPDDRIDSIAAKVFGEFTPEYTDRCTMNDSLATMGSIMGIGATEGIPRWLYDVPSFFRTASLLFVALQEDLHAADMGDGDVTPWTTMVCALLCLLLGNTYMDKAKTSYRAKDLTLSTMLERLHRGKLPRFATPVPAPSKLAKDMSSMEPHFPWSRGDTVEPYASTSLLRVIPGEHAAPRLALELYVPPRLQAMIEKMGMEGQVVQTVPCVRALLHALDGDFGPFETAFYTHSTPYAKRSVNDMFSSLQESITNAVVPYKEAGLRTGLVVDTLHTIATRVDTWQKRMKQASPDAVRNFLATARRAYRETPAGMQPTDELDISVRQPVPARPGGEVLEGGPWKTNAWETPPEVPPSEDARAILLKDVTARWAPNKIRGGKLAFLVGGRG